MIEREPDKGICPAITVGKFPAVVLRSEELAGMERKVVEYGKDAIFLQFRNHAGPSFQVAAGQVETMRIVRGPRRYIR